MSKISAILKKYNDTIDTRKFTRPVGDVYLCYYEVLKIGNKLKPYHYAVVIKEHRKSFEIIPCSSEKTTKKKFFKVNLFKITDPNTGIDKVSYLILSRHISVKRTILNDIIQCNYKAQVIEEEFEKILAAYTKFISDSQNKAKEKNWIH